MKIEITDAAVAAVVAGRMKFAATSNYDQYRDSIRRDLTSALPHLKVTEERKYRVQLGKGRLLNAEPVNIVQRADGRWTDVCLCESPDDAQAIMDALIAAERGAA